MKKQLCILSLIILGFIFSGCTSKVINVEPLDTKVHHIDEICIERNQKVIVTEFLPFVIKEFKKYNIKSKVYNAEVPDLCIYNLQYSANQQWDMAIYFRFASLQIYKENNLIASALYETQNGLDLSKFNSMETKLTPVIDELLKGHTTLTKEEIIARNIKEPKNKNISLEDKLSKIKSMHMNGKITSKEYAKK